MGSLTSQLIVRLIDQVSGPAKQTEKALAGVAKAGQALEKTGQGKGLDQLANSLERVGRAAQNMQRGGMRGWGDDFQAQVDKLKLSARELERVRAEWDRLQASLVSGGRMKASNYFGAIDQWKSKTLTDLRQVRAGYDDLARSQDRFFRRAGRFALTAAGIGSAGYLVNRGGRAAAMAAGEYEREGGRAYLAGMTPAETIRAQAAARAASQKYPSVDASQVMERIRGLRAFTGDFDKGLALLDDHMKALTVLQSIKGKEQAMDQMQAFTKGLDILGRNEDPASITRLLNSYVKALGVDPDLNMGEFAKMAKYAKSGGVALSDEFLGAIAPTFMQDIGGQRLGTMLGSEISQLIAGRGTEKSKEFQTKAGIRTDKGVVDDELLMANPYEWARKHIPGAMRGQGMDPAKDMDVVKFTSQLFSNQMVSDMFAKFITQASQAEKNKALYAGAPGLEAADKLRDMDPFVAVAGLFAQMKNAASALAEGPLKSAIPMLNAFTDAIARLTATLQNNPALAEKAGWATGAAGALGTAAIGKWMWGRWVGGAAGAAGGGGAAAAGGGGILAGLLAGAPLGLAATDALSVTPDKLAEYSRKMREAGFIGGGGAKAPASPLTAGLAPGYSRDFTLGSSGAFSSTASIVPPSGLKYMSDYTLRNVAPGPIGQMPVSELEGLSGKAGAAGQQSGSAFRQALMAELDKALADTRDKVQNLLGALTFTARPSIQPNVQAPAATPGKGVSFNRVNDTLRAAHADYGFETV